MKAFIAAVAVIVIFGAGTQLLAQTKPAGAATKPAATSADKALLGSADFKPTPDRPIGWRGDGTGRFPGATPPTVWAKDKNIIWHTAQIERWPKPVSTPVIVGDRIFIVTEPSDLVCIDKLTGVVQWIRSNNYFDAMPDAEKKANATLVDAVAPLSAKLAQTHEAIVKLSAPGAAAQGLSQKVVEATELDAKIYEQMRAADKKYTRTHVDIPVAPTPCSDGKRVYVWLGHGVAACYDLDGTRRWITLENRCPGGGGHHGYHASPVLAGGKLLAFLVDLLAFDADTGKLAWSAPVATVMGSNYHSSLLVTTTENEPTVLVTENEASWLGIRVSDGKRLWASESLHPWTCGTPVLNNGFLYIDGGKGFAAYRMPAKAGEKGTLLVTKYTEGDLPVASCVYNDGLVYGVNPSGLLRAYDAATAEIVYEHQLEISKAGDKNAFYASLTMAGKYIYVTHNNGAVQIIEPGRKFKSVGTNTLGESTNTAPIFEGNRMYFRTGGGLYCIGEK
jgi:outer membrane protein assembly factor BamB